MLEGTLKRVLKAVFGGGADMGAGNPLEINEPRFDAIVGLSRHKFRKYRAVAVLTPGAPGAWDDTGIGELALVRKMGTYYLYYDGWNAAGVHQFGLATSADLITWIKEPTNPVLPVGAPGAWDVTGVGDGAVIYLPREDRWMMWYEGESAVLGRVQIGLATSTNGINWTKYGGNPVVPTGAAGEFDSATCGDPAVIYHKGLYYMVYSANQGTLATQKVGLATSPDGIVWTKQGEVLPYGAKPNGWTAGLIEVASLYHFGNHVLAFCVGAADASWAGPLRYGLLLTDNFINWIDFPFNPLGPGGGTADEELVLNHDQDIIYGLSWGGATGALLWVLPRKSGSQIPILMIDLAALAGGATSTLANCLEISLDQVQRLAITVECTYDGAATAGIRVHVMTSVDNTNWDTQDWDTWTPGGFAAGATIRETKHYDTDPRFIKVLIENLDAVNAVNNIKVTAILGV